jgi:hypothetical protein
LQSAFETENSTPSISISRSFAPFDEPDWKVITLKRGFFFRVQPHFIFLHLKGRGLSTQPVKIFLGVQSKGVLKWLADEKRWRFF